MLVLRVCLQDQRKQSFLTLAKENQPSLGLYQNPPTFFFTNPRFVLLIRDHVYCFVLSPRLSLITLRIRPTSAAGKPSMCHSQRKWDFFFYYVWNMDFFSYKNAWICYRRPLFTPGAVSFILDFINWSNCIDIYKIKLLITKLLKTKLKYKYYNYKNIKIQK